MNEADVSAVMEMWARESQGAAIDLPWNDIERALELLPNPEARALSDDLATLFLLGPADVLFTVSTKQGKLGVSSQPLNSARLHVKVDWSEPAPGRRATRWTFSYGDEPISHPWQTVSGLVSADRGSGREEVDERELFARMLASRAGWPGYAQPGAQEARPQEPPADAEQREPRWRAMTDVWGKPLRQGRH